MTPLIMFIIYLVVTVGICIYAGIKDDSDLTYIGIFWPAVLVICILAAPFYGAFKLGEWLRKEDYYDNILI